MKGAMMQGSNSGERSDKGRFDFGGFLVAVDSERKSRGVSWRKVARETEISASSLTRFAQGKHLDVVGLMAVANWAGLDVKSFYKHPKALPKVEDTVKEVGVLLRADPDLSPEDATHLESLIRSSYDYLTLKTDADQE